MANLKHHFFVTFAENENKYIVSLRLGKSKQVCRRLDTIDEVMEWIGDCINDFGIKSADVEARFKLIEE